MTSALNGIINFKQGPRNYLDSTIRSQSLAFDTDDNILLYSPSGTNYYEFYPNNKINEISVLDFGAIGNGTVDDTQSFISAINYANVNNVNLKIPSGDYKLTTWATKDVSALTIIGDGYDKTRIIGNSVGGIHFINALTSGFIRFQGISFERFDSCIYSTKSLDAVIVDSCGFYDLRTRAVYLNGYSSNIYITSAANNPEQRCNKVLFINNYIERSQGIAVQAGFDTAIASNNHFKNVIRNLDIWSDSNDRNIYCVCFGWGDNVPWAYCQDYCRRAIITNNTVDGMYNSSPSGARTTNALVAHGRMVVVCNNAVSNISAIPGLDAEAIYCKSQDYICSNNVIYDGSPEGSAITLKGGDIDYTPRGRNNLVCDNIIRSVDGKCKWGIAVFNTGNLTIKNNIIDGTTNDAILLYKNLDTVNIIGNQITNCGSNKIINFSCSQLDNIRIEDNTIVNPTRTSGSILAIRVTTQYGWLIQNSIRIVSGGSGYTSNPNIIWNGTILSNPRLYIRDGVLVGFVSDEAPGATFPPIVTISGGGGTGAIISASELSDGHFRNISIRNNRFSCTPLSTLTEFDAISLSFGIATSSMIENVEIVDNTVMLSGTYGSVTSYMKIVDFAVPNIDNTMNNINVDKLYIHTDLTDNRMTRLVTINAETLSKNWSKYNNFRIGDIYFNNRAVDIPVKSNIDKNISTFSLNFDSTSGYIGNIKLGDIPGNNIVTESYVVNGSTPIKSLTSASTISLYGYSVAGGNQILSSTPISAFSSNSIIQGNQNGQVQNSKMFTATSNGNVPIYLTVGNEPITSGSIKFVVKTMQY